MEGTIAADRPARRCVNYLTPQQHCTPQRKLNIMVHCTLSNRGRVFVGMYTKNRCSNPTARHVEVRAGRGRKQAHTSFALHAPPSSPSVVNLTEGSDEYLLLLLLHLLMSQCTGLDVALPALVQPNKPQIERESTVPAECRHTQVGKRRQV